MKEGYEDTQFDLEQLAKLVKGKLHKSDFGEIFKRCPDSSDLKVLELNRVRITFNKDNVVDSITINR